MSQERVTTIQGAQEHVESFAQGNGWRDFPNVDRFDHLHEELIEMSRLLRYKSEAERLRAIDEKHDEFVDGIGDLFFGLCRLANELGVDVEEAFNIAAERIRAKYNGKSEIKPGT